MSRSGPLPRPRGRRAAWRGFAPAVALLALLGQTSALLHRALVQHATCAEHGESVHVAAAANTPVPAFSLGEDHADLSAPADEVSADHHEHCAAADNRAATTRLVPDQSTALLPAGALTTPMHAAAPGTAVAAYLIAPKTSPPRSAS